MIENRPLATFLSAALMLKFGLGREADADRLEAAVEAVLGRGLRTPDLYTGGEGETEVGTAEVTREVLDELGR